MVHHNGRPDLFKPNAKKYTDEELLGIIADDERVKKIIKTKAVVGVVILTVAIVFAVVRYGVINNAHIVDNKDYSATFEWQTNGLFAEIPQPSTTNGKIVMETEKQVNIELYNIKTLDFEFLPIDNFVDVVAAQYKEMPELALLKNKLFNYFF